MPVALTPTKGRTRGPSDIHPSAADGSATALVGWAVGLDPDISMFWYDPDGPLNVVGYDNPSARAFMDSARAQPTARGAAPYWRRAGSQIAADYPYAFLWFFDQLVAVGPEIEGVEIGVTGLATSAHRWSISRDSGGLEVTISP